jgi:hypothetical protein
MRKIIFATTVATVLGLASPALLAQQAPVGAVVTANQPGNVAAMEAVQAAAKVVHIDADSRTVTLLGPEGRRFNVVAGPEVRNFAQIAVGDEVVIEYIRALSLHVQKNNGFRERSEQVGGATAVPGAKPAGVVGRELRIVADVIGVDANKSTITLRGPDGNTVELDVRNPDHFKVVKVGDQVEANFVESVAIAVQPMARKGGQ